MIRIRDKLGNITHENTDDSFIELCDHKGNLAAIFYENQENGEMHKIMYDSPLAKKYEKLFNVKFLTKQIKYNCVK